MRDAQGRRDRHVRAPGRARAPPAAAHRDRAAAPRRGRADQAGADRHARRLRADAVRQANALGKVRTERQHAGGPPLEPQGGAGQGPGRSCSRAARSCPPARSRAAPGALIWPVNGPITSPFCERRAWERCHPGIDIGVPTGTPIRAADGGRVALCRLGSAATATTPASSTPRTMSTCYAHQSALRRVASAQQCRRARSSASRAAPGTASGRTCTSRCASTAR